MGRFRRQHFMPVPQTEGYDALNRRLFDACAQDDVRRQQGHMQRVCDEFAEEVDKLRALPARPFDTAEVTRPRVTAKGCVQVRRDSEGTRQLVEVLMLHREHPGEKISMAVELALTYGSIDACAVEVLVSQLQTPQKVTRPLGGLGELPRYARPILPVDDYDQLLGRVLTSTEVH